ncbi:MAG: hypothetical protein K0R34_3281 [Herbinix sp.]|jgi:hypothetical protein|nr:hypothetical protein [Herbinix sp.]
MYTNADMTLYLCGKDGKYTRKVINKVFWQEVKQSNVEKTGLSSADSVKIFIPSSSAPDGLAFTTGKDLVAEGEVLIEFDNTSPQTISESLKTLKAAHDVYTVSVADGKLYGSQNMQHYQIMCK